MAGFTAPAARADAPPPAPGGACRCGRLRRVASDRPWRAGPVQHRRPQRRGIDPKGDRRTRLARRLQDRGEVRRACASSTVSFSGKRKSIKSRQLPDRMPASAGMTKRAQRLKNQSRQPQFAASGLGPAVSTRPAYDQNRTWAGWSNGNSATSVTTPFSTLKTSTVLVSTVFPFRSPLFLCRANT